MTRLRAVDPAWWCLGGVLAIAGRGATFYFDDWYFVQFRDGNNVRNLLASHAGHLVLVPASIYALVFSTLGLDDYWALRVVAIALVLISCVLLFTLLRRHARARPAARRSRAGHGPRAPDADAAACAAPGPVVEPQPTTDARVSTARSCVGFDPLKPGATLDVRYPADGLFVQVAARPEVVVQARRLTSFSSHPVVGRAAGGWLGVVALSADTLRRPWQLRFISAQAGQHISICALGSGALERLDA